MSTESKGICGRIGGTRRPNTPWVSRDYEAEVKCEAVQCPVNRNGCCSMPSAILIGPDLRCKTGIDMIEVKAKLPKKGPQDVTGD